jgi:hypothetical protein
MRGLMRDRGIKRIYILGAGFSAPLGMPLTGKLLKLTHTIAQKKPWYDTNRNPYPRGQADWLLQELRFYFPLEEFSHEQIQNEEFSENFDIEKFLSYACAISAFGDDFSRGEDKFVTFLKGWIGEAILEKQEQCMKENISKEYIDFINSLDRSLVLTFNWDTVVETLLDRASKKYDFGLVSASEKQGIPIIKLHGSIDWFLNPCIKDKDVQDVQTEVIRRLDQPDDLDEEEKIHRVKQNLPYFYKNSETLNYPLLVIPGYDKISQAKKLGNVWSSPWAYFYDDLEIIIIGFSLRPDDYHSRAVIYPNLVQGSKCGSLKVKVVDFARSEEEKIAIKKRYEGVENCQFWFEGFNEHVFEKFIN